MTFVAPSKWRFKIVATLSGIPNSSALIIIKCWFIAIVKKGDYLLFWLEQLFRKKDFCR